VGAIFEFGSARLLGCLLGVVLAAWFVLSSQPASGGQEVGAAVSAYSNDTGELAIDPAGPTDFLNDGNLRPGASASGSFRVTNQTGQVEALSVAAVPSVHDLDNTLSVEISSGDQALASGLLGSMADGGSDPLVLGPGETARVGVRVSLPADAGREVAAALDEIAVVLKTGAYRSKGEAAR
jgi:hypothetical protein